MRARKFSSASTWCLVCEFLRPRLQRSEAKKAQGDTHPNRDREKRQKSRVSTAGVTQRKALQRDEGAGISAAGGEGGGGARSNSDNTCQRSSPMPGHARVRRPSGGRLPPLPISANPKHLQCNQPALTREERSRRKSNFSQVRDQLEPTGFYKTH